MRRCVQISVFISAILLVLGYSVSLHAQTAITSGSISGQVADPSGAVIAGATVTATNIATGTSRTAKTNATGFYSFPSLQVGAYTITVSHPGFKTTQIKNIEVQVGQSMAANATLQLGSVSQTVTVTGATPLLRTTEATVSTVVSQNMIRNLPLNGRRYTDFVLLTPNANADGEFGNVSIGGQQGSGDSGYANGNGANSFTVDGASASSNFFGGARGRTRVPYVFGEQSIREFQVSDNPYNAAYGGAGSGFVNTVTKSGTDTFHGGAFYYNRNSGVGNANDAVDKAAGYPRPLDLLQQFGADVGGPMVRHKVWFYFDYEQQRHKEPISIVIPADAALTQTDFPNITAATVLPKPNGPFPLPAGFSKPPLPSDTANYAIYLQQVSNALYAIHSNLNQRKRFANDLTLFPKVDWQPTNADHLTFVYNYSKFDSPGGTYTFTPVNYAGDSYLSNNYVRDHHATIHWTHVFGATLMNDSHVSFTRDDQISSPSGLLPANSPEFEVYSPGFIILGIANYSNGETKEYQWQINERLNYIVGRHTLNFGFDYDRTHVVDFFAYNRYGTYAFYNPTDFALGEYGHVTQSVGNPLFPFTFPYYGFYVQDEFQAMRHLTLDFGLREDFQVYPQPQANTTLGPVIAHLTGQFPNQYQRLSPRFGFAWQPFSKTVVRGGFGMFREILDAINYENSVTSNGLTSRSASTYHPYDYSLPPDQQLPSFPNALPSTAPVFSSSSDLSIVGPGFQTPYILESSLEIQQQLLPSTALTIGTMWTHGTHLISSSAYDLNLIPPTGTTTYTLCPGGYDSASDSCQGTPFATTILPNLDDGRLQEGLIPCTNAGACPNGYYTGQINALISPGNNNYNSFYVQLQQRNFHRLSTMLSYTFSKDLQSNGVDFNNQFDFADTRGPTLLDQRNRLSIAAAYAPAAPDLSNGFARKALSHWTISTVMQFNSGRPYTALLDCPADYLNNSAADQSTGNTADGIGGSTAPCGPVPFIGYNAFYGPWIQEVDLGLSRAFHIGERQTFTVTAQAFNLFNHPNFFVQNGGGINNSAPFLANGTTCGDGSTTNQKCFLTPETGFGVPGEIDQLNGPRTFQFAFKYSF